MYNFPTIKMLWGKKIKDYMFENKVPKKKKKLSGNYVVYVRVDQKNYCNQKPDKL